MAWKHGIRTFYPRPLRPSRRICVRFTAARLSGAERVNRCGNFAVNFRQVETAKNSKNSSTDDAARGQSDIFAKFSKNRAFERHDNRSAIAHCAKIGLHDSCSCTIPAKAAVAIGWAG